MTGVQGNGLITSIFKPVKVIPGAAICNDYPGAGGDMRYEIWGMRYELYRLFRDFPDPERKFRNSKRGNSRMREFPGCENPAAMLIRGFHP